MTTTMRLPMRCALVGAALKGLLLVGWRLSESVTAFRLLTAYDPVSFRLADVGVRMIFGDRAIAPSPAASLTFELLLVIGFALQCLVVAGVVLWIVRALTRSRRNDPHFNRRRL